VNAPAAIVRRPRRPRKAVVSKAGLALVADFLRAMGRDVAAVDVLPDKVHIVTDAGRQLTLPDDEAELDRELQEHMKSRGYG